VSSVQRRARAKENLRRAILDAARELFVTEDYRAISMRRIAEKIEYSPTAIYLHFKDKQEILFQLVQEGFELLNARLQALDIADPVERLRQGGQAYMEFARTQPHYYKLMFQLEDKALSEQCAARSEISENAFGFIVRCVTEAMAQEKFRATDPPMIVAHTIWAHIHGAVSLMLANRLMRLPEEAHSIFYSHVVETTLRGLRADT
jgi:AcrR family transcriptional regulator